MSLFNSILKKLGMGANEDDSPEAASQASGTIASAESTVKMETPAPSEAPVVDVMAKMEGLAAANPQKLNWRTSIVDLLKLLGLDSSYGARKEMATELGCPAEKMNDSAQMNIWLHKTVLKKLAENGGNIPAELLD